MKRLLTTRLLITLLFSLLGLSAAQQSATVGGTIVSPEALPENVRVGVHLVNRDGVWGREISTVVPEGETFSVTLAGEADTLSPFRSGEVVLPGLQNEYRVVPEDVRYARAQVNVYVDENGNGTFDRNTDVPYLGLAGVAQPTGFFVPIYVDRDATLEGQGASLELTAGWNIFTVRFPEGGDAEYAVVSSLEDALLDVFAARAQ